MVKYRQRGDEDGADPGATEWYNKKAYDRILLKDADINGEAICAHAEAKDESLNGFLLRAVTETMHRDNAKTADKEE